MFTKSVDSVVKSLTNMITDLELLASNHADDHEEYQEKARIAKEQQVRAAQIMVKLRALVD